MPKKFQAIKGVRDILPPETSLWTWVEEQVRRVFEAYNFREIRLPIFEETELFARSIGAETDVVSKEMYSFEDRDGKSLTLRPEATASVVRAYIEHQLYLQPGLTRLYYIGPMFRRERPQKGRFRQFYQIGAEVLGSSDHPVIDAEVCEMLVVLLERVRIKEWTLLLNSIGCGECRPKFLAALGKAVQPVKAKMCGDCQHRAETNPLRIFDCKVPADQPTIEKLPTALGSLCEGCAEHFARVKRELGERKIPFTIAPRLVRGLDYYMRTAFEITSPALGAQNSILGGGRYDGLSELLGGPAAKGTGFAIGEDRFVAVVQAAGVDVAQPPDVYIAWMGEDVFRKAAFVARMLRERGIGVEFLAEGMKLKKSISLADKLHARYTLIIGEDELAAQKCTLRRMSDGEQKHLSESELIAYLKSERGSDSTTSE